VSFFWILSAESRDKNINMTKFTYINKKTKKKVYSDVPIKDKDLVLLTAFRDTRIKSNETIKKC
jgi:hypothetical protein